MSQLKDLGDYTFVSKYSKYLKDLKRREAWEEAVNRSRQMHLEKYKDKGVENEINFAFDSMLDKITVGSQRALQFAGPAIFKNNCRLYNCSGTYCDRLRVFQESMFILLSGTGIGVSVQKHHIDKLPKFNLNRHHQTKIYSIPDSIEGWADAVGVLISSYFNDPIFPEYFGCHVEFDYSLIRPEGSEFSHGVGKAPGPEPLKNTIDKIRKLLDRCLKNGQDRLRPIDAYDILMHCSDAVLSGGIRRSASIIIFSVDDEEMMIAKTGNWRQENPQRARSNNSALLLRNSTTKEQFLKLFNCTKEGGEPGFFWADSTEQITNACCEIGFYCYDSKGNSGTQMCNLSSINGSKIKTKKDFFKAVETAAIKGTFQAGFTDFKYLGSVTEEIVRREALLGISITGFMENPDILLNPEIQREAAEIAKRVNKELASKIGINPAARITCVKPEGTTSSLLGTSSGIHPHHSRRFIRRVQANRNEAPANYYAKINPIAVEKSVWSANDTDTIISFACEVNDRAIIKTDLSGVEFLKIVKDTQSNWVKSGKNEDLCVKPWLSHNVSNTAIINDDEWNKVADYIYDNRECFAGISLLSSSGDRDYPQAPFTTVLTSEEIVKEYGEGAVFASGLIEESMSIFGDLWKACDCVLGLGEDIINKKQSDFEEEKRIKKLNCVDRIKKFSKKYSGGNIKKTTYLLKDVYSWKLWLDLQKNHKRVDYTQLIEEENNTKGTQEIACGGGACAI